MFGVAQRQLLPCVQGISSPKIHSDCVCAPPAHLQGVAPTLLPWIPSCAEAVKLGLPQGGCRAGRWAQGWGPGMALPSCHLQLPPVPSTTDPPPAAEGMFSPRSVVTRRFDGSSSCQFLRAPHSQWHPEPSPHVGDGRTRLALGRSLEITLRAFPECSELSTSAV